MKKTICSITATMILLSMFLLSGCSGSSDPGTPPAEVINPSADSSVTNTTGVENSSENAPSDENSSPDESIIYGATTVVVGQYSGNEYLVDMPNNAAVNTMLGYLSSSGMLFPTYTYNEEVGYVAQSIRGSYTRDDEVTVEDVKCGELYLFSDGQLRLYFKDVTGANITATPVGTFTDAESLTEDVIDAYESNKGNSWGVEVYFNISKNVE